jgi:hypothetical protein
MSKRLSPMTQMLAEEFANSTPLITSINNPLKGFNLPLTRVIEIVKEGLNGSWESRYNPHQATDVSSAQSVSVLNEPKKTTVYQGFTYEKSSDAQRINTNDIWTKVS